MHKPDRPMKTRLLGLALLALLTAAPVTASPIKSDERVIFFPTAAFTHPVTGHWLVPLHGWVFEPEQDSLIRAAALESLAVALDLNGDTARSKIFRDRAGWFLVDNERGKRLRTSLADTEIGPTGANGRVLTRLILPADISAAGNGWLIFTASLPAGDPRIFKGRVQLIPDRGVSVISDIDDTIKISRVTDKKALLENTFLKPFRPAPGMAAFYRSLESAGAAFHYVSSSPWQLYPALAEFMETAGFPKGSFHLKSVRLKDETLLNLFSGSTVNKPPIIKELLARWPNRQFILIGDSGEQDPEIYGDIARQFPARIKRILIRNVTGETTDDSRFAEAFRSIPRDKWALFDDSDAPE